LRKTREELKKMERKSMEKKLAREKKDNIGNNQGGKRNRAVSRTESQTTEV